MAAATVLGGVVILYGPDGVTALLVSGTAAAAASGAGAVGADGLSVVAAAGQATSSTTNTHTGGTGGGNSVTSGAGGNVTGATGLTVGGNGGTTNLLGGLGGSNTSTAGQGGIGGSFNLSGGGGGVESGATGTTTGGKGGGFAIDGGAGGAIASAGGTGGAGGAVRLAGGKGAAGVGTNGADAPTILDWTGSAKSGGVAVGQATVGGGYEMDVAGRVNASSGYNGLLFSDIVVPLCALRLTGTQAIATSGADQAVLWGAGTEVKDAFGFHSTSSNTSRLTVPAGDDGVYRIYANLQYASNTTGIRGVEVYKNGSFDLARYSNAVFASAGNDVEIEWLYDLVAGDYVELYAYQTSGGSLNITSNSRASLTFVSRT